ncbi:MAG: sugar-binding domain-containing protein, partial [Candidatus Methylacidiphilales bacterium]
ANFITFLCKSSAPVDMTCHLLQRGKTAGTFQTGFSIAGSASGQNSESCDWQRVVLPVTQFGLKGFTSVAGLGFRLASAPASGSPPAEVQIKDVKVGAMAYTDDSWKNHRLSISINGDWHFATDSGGEGMKQQWFAENFNDGAWKILKSGTSWQEQGVDHYGFGWYRQKLFVPKEFAGTPLTLNLTEIPSDDDVWVNGQRVGGFSGEYKYTNWIARAYTVPPSLIRYGEVNTIVLRIWGGDITFIGNKSGLNKGVLAAELDPYRTKMRASAKDEAVAAELYDLSDAQQGKPLEIIFSFPAEIEKEPGSVRLRYAITDDQGKEISSGSAPLEKGADNAVQAVAPINSQSAHKLYLAGRVRANLLMEDATGGPIYAGTRVLDRLSFAKRDNQPLPALAVTTEDTPYGKLTLIDEIDCSVPVTEDPHPYLQSGFDHSQLKMTPGSAVDVRVTEILGKKARESAYGWFAYRVGRGKMKPRGTYLLRIEYPEDKPRFAPVEIQTGQNYMDVGWKNGVGHDDVYDNWPLSNSWQWYDVIVPLDDNTTGTGGTGTASAENGFWLYFMNKQKPGQYYAMWEGGPAVARIKLYEIDAEKNAPVIHKPEGLPHRVLSFDWERQPDHEPADLVRYAKLMGYNAISPVIIKWAFANYSEPLNGYMTVAIDAHNYWAKKAYDPKSGQPAASPTPGNPSPHLKYLEATKKLGLDYIPRFEWGGSMDVPAEAWAQDGNGQPTRPNRFAQWCTNLLHPAAWQDLKKLMDNMIEPYVKDNPQLTGVLWRIRSNRLPVSYGAADIELFSKETSTPLPPGGEAQRAAWAAGEMKAKYDTWWHSKRAQFHQKLAQLLQSYRPDMTLYYYNWDEDKFGLIQTDITAWAFVSNVVKPLPEGGRAAYEKERAGRKALTAQDYIEVMRTGNFGAASKGVNRADYGLRPELYRAADMRGIQLFAPANYLCYADKPDYLNYFRTADGLAVSNVVSYDEIGARSINPKYEGNMITPGGPAFSMALELLSYFHGDARTLNYTVYTYGRGFAAAHRRFAQAFLALPAIPGAVADQPDADVKVRTYATPDNGGSTYLGVAYKGYTAKKLAVKVTLPAESISQGAALRNLVTDQIVPAKISGGVVEFEVNSGPVELNAYLLK